MTEKQKKCFYFPAWTRCAKANGWRMAKGRLVATPQENPVLPELSLVWEHAQEIAVKEVRGVVPDDLRKACHIVAIGAPKSSSVLTNKECNRVVELFDHLADPDDVRAAMKWMNPEISEKAALIKFIESKAPEAYIRAMRPNRGCENWRDMAIPELQVMCRELRYRTIKWHTPVQGARRAQNQTPEPALAVAGNEYDPENSPF